jgi:hypothetical protein
MRHVIVTISRESDSQSVNGGAFRHQGLRPPSYACRNKTFDDDHNTRSRCGSLVRRKKALLFEKRSKNFCLLVRVVRQRLPVIIKSFLVLFFKKELLAFFFLARLGYESTIKAAGIVLSHKKSDPSEFASGGQGPAPGPRQRRALDPEI